MTDVDAALAAHKFSPDGSIWAPETLQEVRDRLSRIKAAGCPCLESDHLNALHDLAHDDVPVLLQLIERQAEALERVRALTARWLRDAGPESSAHNVFGKQVVSVNFAVEEILAALNSGGQR